MSTTNAREAVARAARLAVGIALGLGLASSAHAQLPSLDPLPSWNDGAAKQAILSFVRAVSNEHGPDFVPVEERVAAFDIDGTLWMETPLPPEVYFARRRVDELVQADSSLRWQQPYQAVLDGDTAYFRQGGSGAVADLLLKSYSGTSQQDFANHVGTFLDSSRHPVLQRRFTETAYTPMTELLAYLHANGFQVWISSGGTADFVRVCAARLYGTPPERIIGTELAPEARGAGGAQPAAGIEARIGKRPILVAGNTLSGGDRAVMEYSRSGQRRSLQLLVNHDDRKRESAYGVTDPGALAAARESGFTLVSMRNDWNRIFNWR